MGSFASKVGIFEVCGIYRWFLAKAELKILSNQLYRHCKSDGLYDIVTAGVTILLIPSLLE